MFHYMNVSRMFCYFVPFFFRYTLRVIAVDMFNGILRSPADHTSLRELTEPDLCETMFSVQTLIRVL